MQEHVMSELQRAFGKSGITSFLLEGVLSAVQVRNNRTVDRFWL